MKSVTDRLSEMQNYINSLLMLIPPTERLAAKGHISGVSSCCVLLALRRGEDPELAAIAGLLHDIYRVKTGLYDYHAHNGAEHSFSVDEASLLLSAIFHHSDKENVHTPFDELLKDADTLDPWLHSGGNLRTSKKRMQKMILELNLPDMIIEASDDAANSRGTTCMVNRRLLLADVAERLAAQHVLGNREEQIFMNMIRYWPEESAADELKNGWCAAFVYHCCYEAGFILPIRWSDKMARFAGVSAWNLWARQLGYFIKDEPGLTPERGDIVLYRNSIAAEHKPPEQRDIAIDHIGVVLGCVGSSFVVAEGNVKNQNQSGIMTHPMHQCVEGFIRIDNAFSYESKNF